MNNWIHLKVSRLYCLNKDLIACQFSLEKDQLVQTHLIVERGKRDNTSLTLSLTPSLPHFVASLHCFPELCALRFVALNRPHGPEQLGMSH